MIVEGAHRLGRIVAPRPRGIPEYWIVDRHPDSRRDGVIEIFKLGVGGHYDRIGETTLSALEEKYGTR